MGIEAELSRAESGANYSALAATALRPQCRQAACRGHGDRSVCLAPSRSDSCCQISKMNRLGWYPAVALTNFREKRCFPWVHSVDYIRLRRCRSISTCQLSSPLLERRRRRGEFALVSTRGTRRLVFRASDRVACRFAETLTQPTAAGFVYLGQESWLGLTTVSSRVSSASTRRA
jgi:hypothetical protein